MTTVTLERGAEAFVQIVSSQAQPTATKPRKKGLLIAPEFPYDSFWSYRYIMPMIGKKAAFPPLGILTFAAYMPDHWDFELVDLNVQQPSQDSLRRRMAEADAVFVGAMSIQKKSLVDLLEGPARGLATPWVLGGPLASSYRDKILNPRTRSDRVLHDGLDQIVWGESYNWIETINALLEATPTHSSGPPTLLIPEQVAQAELGSRRYLNDRSIFAALENVPVPRWDLIDVNDYQALMIQTTAGCPFRCDFCDIVLFNGGFSRPKTLAGVQKELEAIYATGHRGGVFTVDDNFIGDPKAISVILDMMIEFQRQHGYPFTFYTQASLDIGKPELEHLILKMRLAGFNAVFLGIENPDKKALDKMNKKQNKLVDIPETVRNIQAAGIEVYAGFIFGGDEDTPATAHHIVEFVRDTGIFTAMTGLLTPVPYTPLYKRLHEEGRLREAEYSGNNTDDEIQFEPRHMTMKEMRDGIHHILTSLFLPGESYRRVRETLRRIQPHIFAYTQDRQKNIRAALRSLWEQGIRRLDGEYFGMLQEALALDRQDYQEAKIGHGEVLALRDEWGARNPVVVEDGVAQKLTSLLNRAHEYWVRFRPDTSLQEIAGRIGGIRECLQSGFLSSRDFDQVCEGAKQYFRVKMAQHQFPGARLVWAFERAMMGLHYEKVTNAIVSRT